MSSTTIYILIGLSPLFLGGVIALINANAINSVINGISQWLLRKQSNVALAKDRWYNKYFFHPFMSTFKYTENFLQSVTHPGLKNGTRIASYFYLIGLWGIIIYIAANLAYAALIIVLATLFVFVTLYVFLLFIGANSEPVTNNKNQSSDDPDVTEMAGKKGTNLYSGSNWFNEELKGRVDKEGNIYSGTNWFNEEVIGRIDNDGNIFKGSNWFNEEKVGRIDNDGNIYKGSNWFNEEKTGRISDEGDLYKGSNWFNERKSGRTGD